MLKKWNEFIINEDNQEFLDSLDTTKSKYFLIFIMNGSLQDGDQLSGHISEFHDIHPETMRTSPPVLFYSFDWITKLNDTPISPADFRSIVEKEAENLGINTRTIIHSVSELDFETENDLPERYNVDTPKIFKDINED